MQQSYRGPLPHESLSLLCTRSHLIKESHLSFNFHSYTSLQVPFFPTFLVRNRTPPHSNHSPGVSVSWQVTERRIENKSSCMFPVRSASRQGACCPPQYYLMVWVESKTQLVNLSPASLPKGNAHCLPSHLVSYPGVSKMKEFCHRAAFVLLDFLLVKVQKSKHHF